MRLQTSTLLLLLSSSAAAIVNNGQECCFIRGAREYFSEAGDFAAAAWALCKSIQTKKHTAVLYPYGGLDIDWTALCVTPDGVLEGDVSPSSALTMDCHAHYTAVKHEAGSCTD